MDSSLADTSTTGEAIEVMQNLFHEIIQIQKDNKSTDSCMTRIQEIVQESSKCVENSTSPNEMLIDAKILHIGSNYVSSNVSSLNTNLTSFSELKYINGLLAYMQNSDQVLPVGKEWQCFASVTYKMFRKSHPLSFMLGTFNFEPSPVKERAIAPKKDTKKGSEAEKRVLSEVTDTSQPSEAGSDIYDHILKWLVREYKKNERKPINYFKFISDPTDYWKTVENVFHFAFLVRDGTAKMSVENGLPVIEPVLKDSEERVGRKPGRYQCCVSLSVDDWNRCNEKFQIHSPSIPPFIKKS